LDALAIKAKCPHLIDHFNVIAKFFHMEEVMNHFEGLTSMDYEGIPSNLKCSRLSTICEGGGKTRVIGIGDY
jgi:hypothetical protein